MHCSLFLLKHHNNSTHLTYRYLGCHWAVKKPELTEYRCSRTTFDGDVVKDICPAECADSVDEEEERFELKDGVFVTCKWPTKKKTERRCNKVTASGSIVKDICPEVCQGY